MNANTSNQVDLVTIIVAIGVFLTFGLVIALMIHETLKAFAQDES